MTDDLSTRLLEAIAERERDVKRAGDARIAWATWTDEGKARCAPVSDIDGEWIAVDRAIEPTDVLVVWDPAAVLRLCQAHREIVGMHRHERRSGWDSDEGRRTYGAIDKACTSCGSYDLAVRWPCETLRALASAYNLQEET